MLIKSVTLHFIAWQLLEKVMEKYKLGMDIKTFPAAMGKTLHTTTAAWVLLQSKLYGRVKRKPLLKRVHKISTKVQQKACGRTQGQLEEDSSV